MARHLLSETSDWTLSHERQDVRGREVMDSSGARIGTVRDMVVDTDAERVTGLLLDSGTEIPAADVVFHDDTVLYQGQAAHGATAAAGPSPTVAIFDEGGHIVRRDRVEPGGTTPPAAR